MDPAVLGALSQSPVKPEPARTALVAGVVGRLGETVLNQALAHPRYHKVVALAEGSMSLGIRHLSLASAQTLPPVDDVYLLLGDPNMPSQRSFYGRDAAFTLLSPPMLPGLASACIAAGARRVVLISPLPAWQQMSRFHHGLSGDTEMALAALPFEQMVVLRPVRTAAAAALGWVERIAHVYLSIQMMMMPRSIPTLTSDQLARAALDALTVDRPGIEILGAQQIADRIAQRAASDRMPS